MDTNSASVADARVDKLWATLDTRKQGRLDLPALKKGLRKLDHRRSNLRTNQTYPAKRIL
jgi:solute carrier family 25 phosphate transporter 23/24/25/41